MAGFSGLVWNCFYPGSGQLRDGAELCKTGAGEQKCSRDRSAALAVRCSSEMCRDPWEMLRERPVLKEASRHLYFLVHALISRLLPLEGKGWL